MKIDAAKLREGFKYPLRAISKCNALPALQGFKLEASDKLGVTGTDTALYITTTLEADIREPGTAIIPARKLADLVNRLDGQIEFILEDWQCKVLADQSSYSLPTFPLDEFIVAPQVEGDLFHISGLHRVSFAASTEEYNTALAGIYFHDGLIAAADHTRLAELTIGGFSGTALVPANAILFDQCQMAIGSNYAMFALGNTRVYARLLTPTFPRYAHILPESYKIEAEIPVSELLAALQRLRVINEKVVSMIFKDKVLTISANSEDGSGKEVVALEDCLGEIEIYFNPRIVIEGLSVVQGKTIKWGFTAPDKISCMHENGWRYVVMPIKPIS